MKTSDGNIEGSGKTSPCNILQDENKHDEFEVGEGLCDCNIMRAMGGDDEGTGRGNVWVLF